MTFWLKALQVTSSLFITIISLSNNKQNHMDIRNANLIPKHLIMGKGETGKFLDSLTCKTFYITLNHHIQVYDRHAIANKIFALPVQLGNSHFNPK